MPQITAATSVTGTQRQELSIKCDRYSKTGTLNQVWQLLKRRELSIKCDRYSKDGNSQSSVTATHRRELSIANAEQTYDSLNVNVGVLLEQSADDVKVVAFHCMDQNGITVL